MASRVYRFAGVWQRESCWPTKTSKSWKENDNARRSWARPFYCEMKDTNFYVKHLKPMKLGANTEKIIFPKIWFLGSVYLWQCSILVKNTSLCVCLHLSVLFLPSLQESILSHVQRIVKGEVSLAMKEQQAVVTSSIMQAMRSAAGTPVPTAHLDFQTQQANILQLLQQGQLNQAFQQVTHTLTHTTTFGFVAASEADLYFPIDYECAY